MSDKQIEANFYILKYKKSLKIVAAVCILALVVVSLYTWSIATQKAGPLEVFLYGRQHVTPGTISAHRVFVRDGSTAAPIPNADIKLAVTNKKGETIWETQSKSDENGFTLAQPKLPQNLPEGTYAIKVEASSEKGHNSTIKNLFVKRSFKVLITTDKPLYQPGQLIRIRTLSLAAGNMEPAARQDILIEINDVKGNKVFKKKIKTSAFGIAAADFQLADQVNMGEYQVKAILGNSTSQRSVTVKRYRLPKFRIDMTTDRGFYAPGEKVTGHLSVHYIFGKPVAGARVTLIASEFIEQLKPFANITGGTGPDGKYSFSIPLKDYYAGVDLKKGDAFVTLEASVTDSARHSQKKTLDLSVTTRPIRIELFPESGTLVPDVENELYILTVYPDGRPAATIITLGARGEIVKTSDAGIAKIKITPPNKKEFQLSITARDSKGARVQETKVLPVNRQIDAFLMRTGRAVYRAGETADISILAPFPKGIVFVDVVKDRRSLLTQSIPVKEGRGSLVLDIPPDIFGTLELQAYRILPDGNIAGDAKVIQVLRAGDLKITAHLDKKTYRPAEKAILKFAVQRANGEPVQAALGICGVDEAVFALHEMRPGLERLYFMLQEEILKPRYESHSHMPLTPQQSIQLSEVAGPHREEAGAVVFSAAEGTSPPLRKSSESFYHRAQQIRIAKKQHFARIGAIAAFIPVFLFLLLSLPLIGYGLWRLFNSRTVEGVEKGDIDKLKKT
ncbi:MAG: hypothetical protein GY757_46580, partial [bacterium]|nr:hypothetical protein [bacterium]